MFYRFVLLDKFPEAILDYIYYFLCFYRFVLLGKFHEAILDIHYFLCFYRFVLLDKFPEAILDFERALKYNASDVNASKYLNIAIEKVCLFIIIIRIVSHLSLINLSSNHDLHICPQNNAPKA